MAKLAVPTSERQFVLYEALRQGASVEELHRRTSIHRWFLEQMRKLVAREEEILAHRGGELPVELLRRAKQEGFADAYLANCSAPASAPSARSAPGRASSRAGTRCR